MNIGEIVTISSEAYGTAQKYVGQQVTVVTIYEAINNYRVKAKDGHTFIVAGYEIEPITVETAQNTPKKGKNSDIPVSIDGVPNIHPAELVLTQAIFDNYNRLYVIDDSGVLWKQEDQNEWSRVGGPRG